MKPYKFRVWDRAQKRMSIPFELGNLYIDFTGMPKDDCYPIQLLQTMPDRFVVMQCVAESYDGKKLWFEGDIFSEFGNMMTVYLNYFHGLRAMADKCLLTRHQINEMEILGNTWQNPELLEVKNA